MKLGVLNACTPQEEKEFLVREVEMFRSFFNHVENDLELVEYRITEGEFPQLGECEAYLITGSPKGVYDDEPWIAQLQQFIRDEHARRTKMVGVCFGHQMLAHSLGGHAEKSEKGWGMGLQELQINVEQPWMTPELPAGAFHYCHQDQVQQLPPDATLLGGSEFCPNGIFVIGDQVLGMQAHPEFNERVMEHTISWLEEHQYVDAETAEAVSSKGQKADNPVMAQWVVNFLNQ